MIFSRQRQIFSTHAHMSSSRAGSWKGKQRGREGKAEGKTKGGQRWEYHMEMGYGMTEMCDALIHAPLDISQTPSASG